RGGARRGAHRGRGAAARDDGRLPAGVHLVGRAGWRRDPHLARRPPTRPAPGGLRRGDGGASIMAGAGSSFAFRVSSSRLPHGTRNPKLETRNPIMTPHVVRVRTAGNAFQHAEVLKRNRSKRHRFREFFVEGVKAI